MKCISINDRLFDYAEGKLSLSESVEMDKHISTCDHCRLSVTAAKSFLNEMDAEKNSAANLYLAEKIIARVKEKESPVPIWKPLLRLAAVLVIGIGTGILLNSFFQQGNDSVDDALSSENTMSTTDVLGSDNTILSLNE